MVNNTLTVGRIEEGFVLDHIQAGRSMDTINICTWINWTAAWLLSKMPRAVRWVRKTS